MPVRLNKNCIFYHCLLLSTSSVVLQLLGFGYRILLGRLAGAQAIAVYNLVMSAYNVVLSCTLTGVALSVSRIASGYQAVGEGRSIIRLIRTALILFLGLFCLLAIPFGLGRDFFARKVLGNPQTAPALLLIVPCLFLTGFENVHKAFFYGTGQTFAPTVSETLEMLCRIVGALVLFSLARGVTTLSDGQAAALIVCGMILSELVSATFLTTLYRFRRRKLKGRDTVPLAKILGDIASVAVPVSLATLLGRLISSANMVLIPRVLMRAGAGDEAAMEEFGVLSGMTMPMLMLPSAFFSPLITVLSPRFSAGKALDDAAMIRRKAAKALHVVGLFGLPAMTAMLVVGRELGYLLYQNPLAGSHLPMLTAVTLAGFYYAVAESVLESIGLQKRCVGAAGRRGVPGLDQAPHRPLPAGQKLGGPSAAGLGDGGGLCAAALCKAGGDCGAAGAAAGVCAGGFLFDVHRLPAAAGDRFLAVHPEQPAQKRGARRLSSAKRCIIMEKEKPVKEESECRLKRELLER